MRFFFITSLLNITAGCYFVDYFNSDETNSDGETTVDASSSQGVLGVTLGSKAGTIDELALEEVYSATSSQAPASIRPDPDMYARRLLLQHHEEGVLVAKEIGSIEAYRLLLGGASLDFQTNPQEDFDATSLLANISVAERICQGLVAPEITDNSSWTSILPANPSDWETNIKYLAQRFLGVPSSDISNETILLLKNIMDSNTEDSYTNESYISVCTALALDAESLLI